ncbi:MAG: tetratricopeptide repeat protein, partial [Alphaproteobacteria bacterium]|nr:tetratricopeptide repeat protein [Alphaproteobacteria bacterium]
PEDRKLLRRTFVLQLGAGNTKRAVELAERLVDTGGRLTSSTLILAARDLRAGKSADALAQLDNLSSGGLGRFAKPLARAWVLTEQKKYDAALEALNPLAKEKGFDAMHGLHAGLIEEFAGRLDAAEARYAKLVGNPKDASSRVSRVYASLLQRNGKAAEAQELIEAKVKANRESMVLAEDLALLKAGKPMPRLVSTPAQGFAEGLFNIASALPRERAENVVLLYGRVALHLNPDFSLAKLLVGDVLVSRERFSDALKVYKAVPPKTPYGWSARLRKADALYELEKVDEAAKLLEDMAKERPTRFDALLKLGNFYRYKEKFKEAVVAYDRAFERLGTPQRQHWTLYYSRGIALERSKQWDRAEGDFLKALEFEPEQPYVLNYLGYSWVEQGKNIERARKMIERAVQQRQNDGYIVDSMGWVLYRLGQYDEAVTQLERAVQLRPQDPVINDHLGDAYWKVGRRHEARFQWRRALSFEPTEEDKTKIEGKLEKGLDNAPSAVKSETGG